MTTSGKNFLFAGLGIVCLVWAGFVGLAMWAVVAEESSDSAWLDSFSSDTAAGSWSLPVPRKQLRLSYEFSEGWLGSHDFYLTNASGQDLSEVNVTVRLIGENGSPSVNRYWSSWPLGGKQHVSVSVEDVKNVQRIAVSGRASEGDISEELTVE
jgi:hypothetical protein